MKNTREEIERVIRYEPETGNFYWVGKRNNCRAGGTTDRKRSNVYLSVTLDGQKYLLHRLAWFLVYGELPLLAIDHINGNGVDNRIENLRVCNPRQNSENRTKGTSACGFMGVSAYKNKFKAFIGFEKKKIYIGSYSTAEEAHEAYRNKKKELHPFWSGKSAVT